MLIKKILLILLIFLNTNLYAYENNKIDLEKSFIEIHSPKYKWRTSIQSVLISENNTYYLMKEIRAENMSATPFLNANRHLHVMLVNEKNIDIFRMMEVGNYTKSVFRADKKIYKAKKNVVFNKIKFLNINEVQEILQYSKNVKIYCSIEYTYDEIKYNLLSVCDYLNFNYKDKDFFIQPALGYVPFVDEKNSTKNFGYVALNIGKKNRKLEFILNDIGPIFTIYKADSLIKRSVKKILNLLTYFKVKNSFSKLVSIDNSKLSFFVYSR